MSYNRYKSHGFEDRQEYLDNLADQYGIDIDTVEALADELGEEEDFDGLVSALQDFNL